MYECGRRFTPNKSQKEFYAARMRGTSLLLPMMMVIRVVVMAVKTLRALAKNRSSNSKKTERAGMQGKSQGCAHERLQKLAAQCCPLVSRLETQRSDALDQPGSAAVGFCGVICEEYMYSQ
ncbi:hypothetical protein FJTKL_04222 [Diaporthe vaccinii]|uniref:Uncharacterized protein n=1 Tax=Diaporthe vaccinii TaxID=105482 RepID=A0ABR4F068_9PEZI